MSRVVGAASGAGAVVAGSTGLPGGLGSVDANAGGNETTHAPPWSNEVAVLAPGPHRAHTLVPVCHGIHQARNGTDLTKIGKENMTHSCRAKSPPV